MAMPAVSPKRWTAQEARSSTKESVAVAALQVIDGELLVSSGLTDSLLAVQALVLRLAPYTKAHRLGQTLTSPSDIELELDTTVSRTCS
jgi:hypothetical protein